MFDFLTQLKSWGCDVTQSAKNCVVADQLTTDQYKELTGLDYQTTEVK